MNCLTSSRKDLKTLDTFGNCHRPVFLLGVSQHMHKTKHLWKFELKWASKLWDNNGRNTLVTWSCVLWDTWFWDLKIKYWGLKIKFKYFSGKLLRSQKTTLLQREPFLTMFYTINSSPLLVTKSVFMATILLSNYQ